MTRFRPLADISRCLRNGDHSESGLPDTTFGAAPRRSSLAARETGFLQVPNQQDKQETAELERPNAELTKSFRRCGKLLFDCRSQLAAIFNMPELLDEEAEGRDGGASFASE